MGNNVVAGHAVAMAGVYSGEGVRSMLPWMMGQHGIQPWSATALLREKVQAQAALCGASPFRFVAVGEGMAFFGKHIGSWASQLTREKFVQLSLDLFRERGLMCPREEATIFYDVFDSIDLYGNAALSAGELACGLSGFFGGAPEQRASAVCSLLAEGAGSISKSMVHELLKPVVWCAVPSSAEVLRPVLLSYVTDEVFSDMGLEGQSAAPSQALVQWFKRGFARGASALHASPVIMQSAAERAATLIENVVDEAWAEYQNKVRLRRYGRESWSAAHQGAPQYLTDVGVYRYALNQAPSAVQTRALQEQSGMLGGAARQAILERSRTFRVQSAALGSAAGQAIYAQYKAAEATVTDLWGNSGSRSTSFVSDDSEGGSDCGSEPALPR